MPPNPSPSFGRNQLDNEIHRGVVAGWTPHGAFDLEALCNVPPDIVDPSPQRRGRIPEDTAAPAQTRRGALHVGLPAIIVCVSDGASREDLQAANIVGAPRGG